MKRNGVVLNNSSTLKYLFTNTHDRAVNRSKFRSSSNVVTVNDEHFEYPNHPCFYCIYYKFDFLIFLLIHSIDSGFRRDLKIAILLVVENH